MSDEKKPQQRNEPISLYGMTPEEALRRALGTSPPDDEPKRKKKPPGESDRQEK